MDRAQDLVFELAYPLGAGATPASILKPLLGFGAALVQHPPEDLDDGAMGGGFVAARMAPGLR